MEICLLGLLIWCFHLKAFWAAGIFQHQRSAPPKARTPKMKEWMPSSSSSSASAFTLVPTPNLDKADSEGLEAAVAFLYSGDMLSLSQANCTWRFEVRDMGKTSSPPPALRSYLRGATDTLTHATNFLNMVFQTNDIRESSVKEDVEWYHALVRSVMEGDSQVYRATLTFDAHPVSSKPQMMLQATKENNEILLQDLSPSAESLRNLTWENEWYNFFRFQRAPLLYKRILSNDLKTLDTPKWSQGDSYVMDTGHIKWSPPFLECEDGKFLPTWMVTLSSSFYGLKPDLNPEFKGVLRMDVKIQNIDINQCASGQGWFANTHQCDLNSTQCVPQENQGFVLGKYLCICNPGFYGVSRAAFSSSAAATNKEQSGESASQYGTMTSGNLLECRPCQEGCTTCTDDTPCLIQEDWSLRAAVLAFQAFCMLAVFFSMLVSYHFRKSKRIRASGVLLLETILFGSLLLYFPVFILYFKPSIFRCIVLRWVRMLGFAIVYGTITLKLYRVLKIFLSRTAQRVPYMSSGRVLKMLALILLLVLWFLAAWTVGMLENIEKNIPLVVRSQTTRGLQFYICDHDRWDYMMVVAEMLFLFWGIFLCYATRTVPSAFHEPRYMGIALHNELITSAAFHVVRFLMVPSLHPDWTLLLFFIHTHVTTTMTLALLFIPKFLHAGSPLREEIAAEVYEDELDMRHSGSYLNSSITSAWSEHSLDPDDIRDELKKLYTQLEVHKTKKMTANNPHLQKKRSSKRGLGRSLMRRITEIPESVSRQSSKDEKDGSVGGGTRSHTGSYKRRHLDTGSSSMKLRDDTSSKEKVGSSLKKSHSTYDHTRDAKENSLPSRHNSCKEAPLLDSMMRKKLAKKASERSNSDSLEDSVPLVYKSASAHNLMSERKPLHPKPSPLQKSLSVVTSAKEKALLLTSRACLEDSSKLAQERRAAVEDSTTGSEVSGHTEVTDVASEVAVKHTQMDDTSEGTVSSLLEDSHESKDIVCPWESATAPSTPSESRSQKHVTYATIRSVSINTSEFTGRRHHASKKMPPEPPIRQQSLVHSLEKKDTVHWDQAQPSSQSPKTDSKDSPILANISPRETEKSPEKTKMERTREPEDSMPVSSSTGLTRLASIAAEVCPWEVMEMPPPKKKDPDTSESDSQKSSPEKQPESPQTSLPKGSMKSLGLAIKAFNRSRIKTAIKARKDSEESQIKSEKDMDGKTEKPKLVEVALMPVGGSPGQQGISRTSKAKIVSKQATICPWDEEEEEEARLSSQSKTPEVCPWEESPVGLGQDKASSAEVMPSKSAGEISSIRLEQTKSLRESVCPWETIDEDQKREDKTSDVSLEILKTDDKKAEACPWEVEEVTASARSDTQSWGVRSAFSQDEAIKGKKVKPSDGDKRETSSTKAYPSETEEKASAQHDLKEIKEPSKEIKKSSEVSYADEKKLRSTGSSKAIPPASEEVRVKTQVCPWEVEEPPSKKKMPEEDSAGSSTEEKSTASKAEAMKKSQEDSICPWETMELQGRTDIKTATAQRESNNKANFKATICPWEVSDTLPEKLKEDSIKDSRSAEGRKLRSPLSESKDSESSYRGSVCPWENAGVEDSSTKPAVKIAELPKVVLKASSSGDSKKVEVCPWESETAEVCPWDVASPTLKKGTKQEEGGPSKSMTPELPKAVLKASSSGDSKKVEVCPWESETTEVCPWDVASPTLKKGTKQEEGGPSKSMTPELPKAVLKASSSGDSKKVEVCPWETETAEVCPWEVASPTLEKGVKQAEGEPSKSMTPELSKAVLKASSSGDTKKMEVCPWETEKAEVCPWEVASPTQDTGMKQAAGRSSKGISMRASHPPKTSEYSIKHDSVCPWEDTKSDDAILKPGSQPLKVSDIHLKKPDNFQSKKAEIAPWEMQEEIDFKATICPWENDDILTLKRGLEKDASELSKEEKKDVRDAAPEKASNDKRESVCPWESIGSEDSFIKPKLQSIYLSKGRSKTSDSVESQWSAICPWETEDTEVSTNAAEICPWDVTSAPSTERITRQEIEGATKNTGDTVSKAPKKVGSPRESICPWETRDTDDLSPGLSAKSPSLSKVSSKKSSSTESFKTEVCPWESQAGESSSKADVCPWEVPESPVRKRPSLKAARAIESQKKPLVKQAGSSKTTERMTSPPEPVCPWDSVSELSAKPEWSKIPSKKSDSAESLKAEVCPWEVEESVSKRDDDGRSSKEDDNRSTSPVSISEAMEKLSRSCEDICPWESMELEESSVRSAGQSPALSKAASRKSDSAESLRAEVCPWETMEEEEETAGVDICPWTAATAPFEKGKLRQSPVEALKGKKGQASLRSPDSKKAERETTFKKIEKSKSQQEPALVWKSMEFDKPPAKSTRSLDLLQVSSKKSEHVESLTVEVCPWEFQELQTETKAEGLSERESLKMDRGRVSSKETRTMPMTKPLKTEDKVSRSRESVCPWESMELPSSPSPTLSKAGSKKSDSIESLRAEVCPWETEEEECPTKADDGSLRKKTSKSKIGVMKMEGETSSKKVEKTHSHPGLACTQKSSEELSIKPMSKSLDLSKVGSVKSDSVESLKAEICPWETQEITAIDKAEVCLWEAVGIPLGKGTLSKDRTSIDKGATKVGSAGPGKTFKAPKKASSPRESICPWESSAAAEVSETSPSISALSKKSDSTESRRAEVCPWEPDHSEASPKEEICPWEVGTVMPGKEESNTTHVGRTEVPTVSMKRSQSKQEGLPAHKPLCRSLPDTTPPKGLSMGSSPLVGVSSKDRSESTIADVCPWEAEEGPSSTKTETAETSKTFSEVCPWEAEGTSPTSESQPKSKTEKSQTEKAEGPSKAKSDICPWDCD